ncbi:DNA-binding pseudobarrel domain-containing protein, partial [Tanacetum coccineum]
WLPPDFVKLAGIDGKKNIIIKCLDGNERQMVLRPVKRKPSTQYCLSMGWPAFKRSNNISEGDECVFKYITSEDKMSLAKVTKKIIPPTEVDVNDLKVDDGMDGKDVVVDDNKDEDENVEPVDDGMDGKDVVVDDNKDEDENVEPVDDGMDGKNVVVDDNKDEDENVEPVDDGMDVDADDNKDEDKDAEFVATITPINKSKLVLPKDFVVLAGIESKENIIMKSLDGNETKMSIRTDKRHRATYYHLSVGWPAFKRSNNISEGDKCVFKYITSEDRLCLAKFTKAPPTEVEDKMCVAKVTKEKTQTRLPSPADVVKRKRGRLPPATENKMTAAENVKMRSRRPPPVEITVGEAVKRKRGWTPTSSPRVAKDVKRKKGPRLRVHSADVEGVDEGVAVGKKRRGRPVK